MYQVLPHWKIIKNYCSGPVIQQIRSVSKSDFSHSVDSRNLQEAGADLWMASQAMPPLLLKPNDSLLASQQPSQLAGGEGVIQGFDGVPQSLWHRGMGGTLPLLSQAGIYPKACSALVQIIPCPFHVHSWPRQQAHCMGYQALFWVSSSKRSLPFICWEWTDLCAAPRSGVPAEGRAPQGWTTQPYWISAPIAHVPNMDFPKTKLKA